MIFVTVGTERFPFDRLIRAIDHEVSRGTIDSAMCQIGVSQYEPTCCLWARFLPFPDIIKYLQASTSIVAHAGVGISLLCVKHEKVPILVPRRKYLEEQVDDHQVTFAQYMDQLGYAIMAENLDNLDMHIARQNELQQLFQHDKYRDNGNKKYLEEDLDDVIRAWSSKMHR